MVATKEFCGAPTPRACPSDGCEGDLPWNLLQAAATFYVLSCYVLSWTGTGGEPMDIEGEFRIDDVAAVDVRLRIRNFQFERG